MKKKLLALLLVLVMVLSVVPAVSAEGSFMNVQATPSVTTAAVGDTIEYTITATGSDITALEFTLVLPEGLSFVTGSGSVPAGLKGQLGWAATDWTESSMKWTGYSDTGAEFVAGTVLMTFSCVVEAEGEYQIELFDLLPFDGNFEDVIPELSVGTVTVGGNAPVVPEGAYMDVKVVASAAEVAVGDTINYTVLVSANDITALEYTLVLPEGLTFVSGSGVVPAGLKDQLGWAATDWTESSMKWTGYSDTGANFGVDTTIMTFSCVAAAAGTYQIELVDLLPFDGNFEDVIPTCTVDTVTVAGGACEHTFGEYVSNGDATCTADGTKTATCTACGETDTVADAGSAKGHSFGEYVANGDATCTADGTKTATCSACGETDTVADTGSALGHDWADATCDCPMTCKICGATEGSALTHTFGEYTSNGDATCTEDGTKTAICVLCGAKDTVTDEGSALGHSFGEYTYNNDATCTADGTKTATCSACGETDTVAAEGTALGHDWADATCTAPMTCKVCGATEGSALGHSFGEYTYNDDATCTEDGTKTATCSVCGESDTVAAEGTALGHDWADADCVTAKTCKVCGATEGEALGHVVDFTSNDDATCTEDGTKTGVCSVCEETITVTDEGTALGHDLKEVAATAGCETAGHTGYYACSVCDAWFEDATGSVEITDKDSVNVDGLGHDDVDGDGVCDACDAVMPTEPSEEEDTTVTEPDNDDDTTATEPSEKPETPDEEIPKTGNNGMMLYVAMMVLAACGIFCTVVLGKKKYMA